ncbi:MAG: OB-fold nucleic acid binding domain-containing protein [Candidatus Bathyarchaeia archaeon]
MTTQDLINEIKAKKPQVSEKQILEQLDAERTKCAGLLCDETLLRLIAAKWGVEVQQSTFNMCGVISSGRLFSGLYDVAVAGRLVAVFPAKTFQGQEKSGKFATLMLGDNEGLLRVVLWNDKAELVEKGELKAGQAVRFLHGYTRDDRYGKTELHLGDKSLIELQPNEKSQQYPPIENFTTKIASLNPNSGNVHICGSVKAVLGKSGFTRSDDTDGVVLRLALRDDTGEAVVVVWNEKVDELEKQLRESSKLLLVNARVKEGKNGAFEVHVDSNTFVEAQKS